MKIKYRPAAIQDMDAACAYLRDQLHNSAAADALIHKILHSISLLKDNPYMEAPLTEKLEGLETDIRFLIVSKQLVFYQVGSEIIEIIRVLDGRTDYLAKLFD